MFSEDLFNYTPQEKDVSYIHVYIICFILEYLLYVFMFFVGFSIGDNTEDTQQQILEAYQMLQNQVFLVYLTDIMLLGLVEVSIANNVKIKSNGVITMKTADSVEHVFNMLNEMSKLKI